MRMMMKRLQFLIFSLLLQIILYEQIWARIIRVPSEYSTIQAGINAAANGDTVLIADGTYTGQDNRNIRFYKKSIIVISENGSERCIIDCEGRNRGFIFDNQESHASILQGLTIKRGYSIDTGGGIFCSNASPIIVDCAIIHCYAVDRGGGISIVDDSSAIVQNCEILNNEGAKCGGGIYCSNSQPEIILCKIWGNYLGIHTSEDNLLNSEFLNKSSRKRSYYGRGGCGIGCNEAEPIIYRCDIRMNYKSVNGVSGGGISFNTYSDGSAIECYITGHHDNNNFWGAGIEIGFYSNGQIFGCVIESNSATQGGGIMVDTYSTAEVMSCLIRNNASVTEGGGIFVRSNSISLKNSTILNNTSESMQGGALGCSYSNIWVENCIIRSNVPNQVYDTGDCLEFIMNSTNIEGGYSPGNDNFDANPLFTTGPGGAYYLSQIAAGQSVDSPCLNRGTGEASDACIHVPWLNCMNEYTTRTDEVCDGEIVDVGFHYPIGWTQPPPHLTPTPTVTPSGTGTSTPLSSPIPSSTSVPTQTPSQEIGVRLSMPAYWFRPGDRCCLIASIYNSGAFIDNAPFFVLLEIAEQYWYWDDWGTETDYNSIDVWTGVMSIPIINEFAWPELGGETLDGLIFWSALTDPAITYVLGGANGIGCWEFGYGP